MNIWIALLLGLVQGVCEFLPVSSSGHLVLMHNLFGIEEGALFFTIMLHVGTLFAVFAAYLKEIGNMLRHPFQRKVGMLFIALIPTVVIALLFRDFFKDAYGGRWLGIGFLLTAALLMATDSKKPPQRKMKEMRIPQAALIGLMQGVAILPGVSRSGATIAGGVFAGVTKKEAADFSFLLSIPAILGGVAFDLPDLIKADAAGLSGVNWPYVLAGMAVAAVSGYFAIRLTLRVIKKNKLWPFALYTAILGVFILIDQLFINRFFVNPFAKA
ncbi:MAG: undecaprenyl-diphosphate phosphatase [Clostridiales bacterium]|jgi:undecaprenyl-diphosphatase|nr:undecaprenyl-diphosphate phosphatase [Clostridiales bacterium]